MQDLTSPSFPLHFVQVARVLWFVAMLAMPWDWAADLGLAGTAAAEFIFCLAYFSAERVAIDMESPFGGHPHAVPLDNLLSKLERMSRVVMSECGQGREKSDSGGDDDRDKMGEYAILPLLRPLCFLESMISARTSKLRRKEAARRRRRKLVLNARASALSPSDNIQGAASASSNKSAATKNDVETGRDEALAPEAWDDEFALEFLGEEPVELKTFDSSLIGHKTVMLRANAVYRPHQYRITPSITSLANHLAAVKFAAPITSIIRFTTVYHRRRSRTSVDLYHSRG